MFAPVVISWELRELGGAFRNCFRLFWLMKDLWNLEEKRPECLAWASAAVLICRDFLLCMILSISVCVIFCVAQKIDIHNEAIGPRWEVRFNPCCGFIRQLKTEPSKLDVVEFLPSALIWLT
jgi:hypothetical protein